MFLTRDKIQPGVFSAFEDCAAGAEIVFMGKIRNHSRGKSVLYLEYEAYEAMAEKMIEENIRRAYLRWPITQVRILHRIGKVELGEISVLIQVQAAHRDEAYKASRFLIDSIKHNVPIWKKEFFENGTYEWSLCHHGQPAAH
jgi:molybdopterin synthase catalytic subunit